MIDIKTISGITRHSVSISEKAIYKKELMKEEYILLTFSTDRLIPFQKGDYILTEYGRFEIADMTFPKENASTGGYDYELRFDSPTTKWKNKILFYTRQGNKEKSWSLTSKIGEFMKIIEDNLKDLGYKYNNLDYHVESTGVEDISKPLSFDGVNIFDAITQIAQAWETEWYVVGNKIFIGKCEYGNPVVFDSSNIVDMSRNDGTRANNITRLYPSGLQGTSRHITGKNWCLKYPTYKRDMFSVT